MRIADEPLTDGDPVRAFCRDDPNLGQVVERAFAKLSGSCEIAAICRKWLLKPLPSGIRLKLPMSPYLEQTSRVQRLPKD